MATVLDVLQSAANFHTFVTTLETAGMADTLNTTDDITVFAPTDAAFSALPAETISGMLRDSQTLADLLSRHVVHTRLDDEARHNASMVQTFGSEHLPLNGDLIHDARIVTRIVQAENGIVYGIDAVLLSAPEQSDPPAP